MPVQVSQRTSNDNRLKNIGFSGRFCLSALLLTTAVTGLGAGTALGRVEDPGRKQLSLSTRQNPAYDPQGIRVGDFIFSTALTNSVQYNDNVYATELNAQHDLIYSVSPTLGVRSDFVRHAIGANVFLERGIYRRFTSENYDDYGAGVNGRFDLTGQTAIPFKLNYTRDHIRRGGPDERRATEPSFFQLWEAVSGIAHQSQVVATKFLTTFRRYIYDDTTGTDGIQDNGDRDRQEFDVYGSIGMNTDAIFAPFVYSSVKKIDYMRKFDSEGFQRSAMEYEAGVGTVVNFSDITSGSFTIGRLRRDPDDPTLEGIDDFAYSVSLKWEPSTLASFLLTGDRTVDESTREGVTGSVTSTLRLNMDYELYPNFLIQPSVAVSDRSYEGEDAGQTLTTDAAMRFTYKMNQNLWLTGSYQYTNQDIKEAAPDLIGYKANVYGLSLKLQF